MSKFIAILKLMLIIVWDIFTSPVVAVLEHVDNWLKLGAEATLQAIKEDMAVGPGYDEELDPTQVIQTHEYSEHAHHAHAQMMKNGMFKGMMYDPLSGGASTVRVCGDYPAYLRLQEAVIRINSSMGYKIPKIKLTLTGVPDSMMLGDDENGEMAEGPFWCDIKCDSIARIEQLIDEVEAVELAVAGSNYQHKLELVIPENATAELKNDPYPWPWHPFEQVQPHEVPVDQVPRWGEQPPETPPAPAETT